MGIEIVVHHQCRKLFSSSSASASVHCRLPDLFATLYSVCNVQITEIIYTQSKELFYYAGSKSRTKYQRNHCYDHEYAREALVLGGLGFRALAFIKVHAFHELD